jgi:hypothetical protein
MASILYRSSYSRGGNTSSQTEPRFRNHEPLNSPASNTTPEEEDELPGLLNWDSQEDFELPSLQVCSGRANNQNTQDE